LSGRIGRSAIRRALLAIAALGGLGLASGAAHAQSPNAERGINIVAAGDIADCGSDGTQFPEAAHTAALIQPDDAVVLTLGDHAYPIGAPESFTNCFAGTWGQARGRIRPAPGNHDYMTTDAAGYFGYFGAAAGPGRRGYYSFDLGGWHFISLNSNVDAGVGSPQYEWLQADLAASADTLCTIAYWHHPVFSSGPHGNDPRMVPLLQLLHGAGVEVVLAAHDHVYERFAPQDAIGNADPERGVRAFTAGTGGAVLYSIRSVRPNSEFRDNRNFGVLRLTLMKDSYRWVFVPAVGALRDEGSDRCHR
jgi:hypothetical protein